MSQSIIKAILFIMVVLGLLSSMTSCTTGTQSKQVKSNVFKYRARSLENSQAIVIWDRLQIAGGETPYMAGDTVPVNMATNKIDHKDSVSMYCVIEREFTMAVDSI